MTAGPTTAPGRPALPFPSLLLRSARTAAATWRAVAAWTHTMAVLSWRALCLGLLAMTAMQAGLMLVGGNTWYTSPTYRLFEQVPGGMRSWGLALAALWGTALYGYGKSRAGRGQVLRWCLAGLAGWFVLWLLTIVGTWVIDWRIGSANALPVLLFFAWLSVLVGRATPPDRT